MASETQEKSWWSCPVAKEGSSVVWKYFEIELPDKNRVRCIKCPARYFKYTGSTHMMWYHLEREHHIHKSTRSQAFIRNNVNSRGRQSQIQSATTNCNAKESEATVTTKESDATTKDPPPVIDLSVTRSCPTPLKQMSIANMYLDDEFA